MTSVNDDGSRPGALLPTQGPLAGLLTEVDDGLEPGQQLGAYRLLEKIGGGGMGVVWLAEHTLLGRRAAVKILHPSYSCRSEVVQRFFNEARAATAIADPGIVQIFDFGVHGGRAYIVMELLEGETLAARADRALSISDALRIMRQVATSLGVAHASGIVHRDLKPENIFVVRDAEVLGGERAKILDFGIAKLGGDNRYKTQTATIMGTPAFMSPEQCRGAGQVDQRSDVYSLGCVLFAILVGRAPFDAEGVGEIIAMQLTEEAPLASSFAADIPPAIDALIARCLDKAPAARFASGTELAAAIDALLDEPRLSRSLLRPPSEIPASPTTLSRSVVALATPPRRHRRMFALGGALVAIATIAVLATMLVTRDDTVADAGDPPPLVVATVPAVPAPAIAEPSPVDPDRASLIHPVLHAGDTPTPVKPRARVAPNPVILQASPPPVPVEAAPVTRPVEPKCRPDANGIPTCRRGGTP